MTVAAELGSALREFLAAHAKPVEGADPLWPRLRDELGLDGLLVPEAHGGLGLGTAELIAVASELGRAVVGGPFIPSAVTAATVLSTLDLPPATATTLAHVPFRPSTVDGDDRITGVVGPILAADGPLLVPVGDRLLLVTDGFTLSRLPSLDLSRPAFRVEFQATPAVVLAEGPQVAAAVRRAEVATWIALGAECVGVAGHALELTVEHAKTRHQFGRPIGAFQAMQHKLADLAVTLEVARSAAEFAVRGAGADAGGGAGGGAGLERAAHALAVKASEAAVTITTEAIQLHGGIGFTWEYPAHVLLRRAHAAAVLAGTPDQHRRALFALVDEE
ncbi:acyl-CoA dehydrogenase family protein [Dactylosporangium sp. CS-033363]|uniref:acyl-CoA dehydrogenase family protein n=1 Tax=Dactylosporangium sp. CS-033363 TaxID=3239935 RepID=UPI003D8F099E